MKKITLIVFSIFALNSCAQEKKEKTTQIEKEMPTYSETYKDTLPDMNRRMYDIGLTVPGPFELYINDIPVRKTNSPSMHNTAIDVNPYVLKSGKYNFKLRLLPMPEELKIGGIQPSTPEFMSITFETYAKNTARFPIVEEGSFKVLKKYNIPKITEPVPYLDIEGEFEVELPYDLVGWSKSKVFKTEDIDEILPKVVAKYNQLRNMLNEGKADEYIKQWNKADKELNICNYTTKEQFEKENNDFKKEVNEELRGTMAPIEDFTFNIYGQGRLIKLERKETKIFNKIDSNLKGRNVLLSLGKSGGSSSYSVFLHMPAGSNEFEIIRK